MVTGQRSGCSGIHDRRVTRRRRRARCSVSQSSVLTYSFHIAPPMSIGASLSSCCASWILPPALGVLEDRFLVRGDVGAAGALEAEQLVERDRPFQVADVDAVLVEPGVGPVVAVLPRVALRELDEVAVGILDETDRHRPLVHPLRLHHDLGAGGDRVVEHLVDVVRRDVELPERVAHVDGTALVELLRELELAALVGVLDDRFLDGVEIGAAACSGGRAPRRTSPSARDRVT